MVITGSMINNYFKCKRQLHLVTSMNMNYSSDSTNMIIGKLIEDDTYKRRSKKLKQYNIGVGVVDFIDFDKKIIYETKKSSSHLYLAVWQLMC